MAVPEFRGTAAMAGTRGNRKFQMRALLILALLAPLPALAEVRAVTRVYSQVVAYALPDGFVPAFEDNRPGFYIQEAVPAGQSVQDWTQMLTMTGAEGRATTPPEAQAQQIAQGFAAACPGTYSATALPPVAIPGAGATFVAHIACGNAGGRAEEMLLFVLAGARDIYTVQWAARGAPRSTPLAVDPAIWVPRYDALAASIRLCDPVSGEGPPYPSCR